MTTSSKSHAASLGTGQDKRVHALRRPIFHIRGGTIAESAEIVCSTCAPRTTQGPCLRWVTQGQSDSASSACPPSRQAKMTRKESTN